MPLQYWKGGFNVNKSRFERADGVMFYITPTVSCDAGSIRLEAAEMFPHWRIDCLACDLGGKTAAEMLLFAVFDSMHFINRDVLPCLDDGCMDFESQKFIKKKKYRNSCDCLTLLWYCNNRLPR